MTIETDIARLVRKEYPSLRPGEYPSMRPAKGLSRGQKWAIALALPIVIFLAGGLAPLPFVIFSSGTARISSPSPAALPADVMDKDRVLCEAMHAAAYRADDPYDRRSSRHDKEMRAFWWCDEHPETWRRR